MKYRKKPVEIEAMQLIGNAGEIARVTDWMQANLYPFLVGDYTRPESLRYHDQVEGDDSTPDKGIYIDPADGNLMIRTLEGDMRAEYGDWIIRGVEGEFYPCKPGIFEQTYEDVGTAGKTNHAATAEARLEFTLDSLRNDDIEDAQGHAAFAAAQVSATLALVEQQRFANLIALVQMQAEIDENTDLLAGEAMHALIEKQRTPATPFSGPDDIAVIRSEVREALGL